MLAEYSMRLEEIQGSLNVFEKKHFDLQQQTIGMKSERDDIKNKLFRESIRYKNCADQMARLDKEIEDVLGRAVSNNDLDTLYKLDLKDLNEINKDGVNSQLTDVAQNIAATKIQSISRGKKARHDVEVKKFQEKRLANKMGTIYKSKLDN